jgi:hypothetical protein
MSENITVNTVAVEVIRGLERIRSDVMAHEVPIVQAVHGRESVQVVDEDAGDAEIPNDAGLEYERLVRVYDRKNFAVVREVYRSPDDLASKLGIASGAKKSERAQSSQVVRKPARKAAKSAK